ncbi:MAG: hypothetical protein ABIT38_17375 [Gemmatimonadaceae bacterium]
MGSARWTRWSEREAQRAAYTGGRATWMPAFDDNYVKEAVERLWLEATGDTEFARHGRS